MIVGFLLYSQQHLKSSTAQVLYQNFKLLSCLWINVLVKESTEGRVVKYVLRSVAAKGPVDVVQLCEERIGQRGEKRNHPNQCNDLKEISLFQSENSCST